MSCNWNASHLNDTIAAIATPAGPGGIGIIRLSGPEALSIALGKGIFHTKSAKADAHRSGITVASHRMIYGQLIDPVNQQVVDEVLIVVMRAPHSYTCEDVVEFQCHGGPVLLSKILEIVVRNGARLAEPGEFTRRAFLNGRIDLSQAEAVADIISAKSGGAAKQAAAQLAGGLKTHIEKMIGAVVSLLAEIEGRLEFPEEIESSERSFGNELLAAIENEIIAPAKALIAGYPAGRMLKEGIRLAIIGRPNVGKSSLLNCLIGRDKAIVADIPGTTRDIVEDELYLDGVIVQLKDTAGLHRSNDPVERQGIAKTRLAMEDADLVLWVVDATNLNHPDEKEIFNQVALNKSMIVINKVDLVDGREKIALPNGWPAADTIEVSAKQGDGIAELKAALIQRCRPGGMPAGEPGMITNIRQKGHLDEALEAFQAARTGLKQGVSEEFVSVDLNRGLVALKKITGENIESDVLDVIFQKFCIGK